jgi:glycosyltransferase involved in cell wall biosynthesis
VTHTALPFSLLLPVYLGDRAEYFTRAFSSAVVDQTRRPTEVVLVQDGPISPALAEAIDLAVEASPVRVRRIDLEVNVGLAVALTEGLAACSYDVVARMDADDISLPERFAKQLPMIEAGCDLVGTGMLEFNELDRILGRRVPPVGQDEIARQARFRDPFNHPTVVYRKSAVEASGGYRHLPLMEDYWLFARMIAQGATVQNLPDPLVMYRVDSGAYNRRGGFSLFQSELALQRRLLADGFVSRGQFLRNVVVRGGYRFVPVVIRRAMYRTMAVSKHTDTAQ